MQITVVYNPYDKTETASLKRLADLDLNTLAQEMSGTAEEALDPAPVKKRGRPAKVQPEPTVSEDEDEDFGKKEMTEEDLEDDDAEEDGDSEEDDDGSLLTFDEVRAAINKYGAKNPEGMKTLLLGFNLKSSKELQKHKSKWEPVYRKVMAKLKALKKSK